MNVGAFSISLAVKNLQKSKSFYEELGFSQFAGDETENWLIMKNGDHIIGLFQNMFEGNIMTFNPGWDQNANELDDYTDIREIHKKLKQNSDISFLTEVDDSNSGPTSFMIQDPDGNTILFDQHR